MHRATTLASSPAAIASCKPDEVEVHGFEIEADGVGVMKHRDQYVEDVFSLVEPEDIRWVFISHDDVDHTGNLNALMELAPNATLVIDPAASSSRPPASTGARTASPRRCSPR